MQANAEVPIDLKIEKMKNFRIIILQMLEKLKEQKFKSQRLIDQAKMLQI